MKTIINIAKLIVSLAVAGLGLFLLFSVLFPKEVPSPEKLNSYEIGTCIEKAIDYASVGDSNYEITEGVPGYILDINFIGTWGDDHAESMYFSMLEMHYIFEYLQYRNDIAMIRITSYLDGVDDYGNKTTESFFTLRVSRETLEKINFDGYDFRNWNIHADEYILHHWFQPVA